MLNKTKMCLECRHCHYKTSREPSRCPVCGHAEFGQASSGEAPHLAHAALAFYSSQTVRMLALSQRLHQGESLRGLGELQGVFAEGLSCCLGDPLEELEHLLQDAIEAQYSQLPALALQAEEEGASALAIQLKWLASRQGDVVSALAKLKELVQFPQ